MKIAIAQQNYIIGDIEGNSRKIMDQIRVSAREGADLLVFSEMSLTGYPVGDLLEYDEFISRSEAFMHQIAAECHDITVIVGAPSRKAGANGKTLCNSAWILANGEVKQIIHKRTLINRDEFDEVRYFEAGKEEMVSEINGKRVAVVIGDFQPDEEPLKNLQDAMVNISLIINIAASPFHYNQSLIRRKNIREIAKKYSTPIIYINHVGAQVSLIYDGGSLACDAGGNVLGELPYFIESTEVFDLNDSWYKATLAPEIVIEEEKRDIALIHDALVLGIRDYFGKSGFKKAVLGLSGGIDSAVVMALAATALDAENVLGILLPSQFSPGHSVDDARGLAVNLGSPHEVIPIKDTFYALENTLKPHFKDLPFDVTEENMQARIRAVILMAMSNKFGYILLNTSNKSEAAVGYGTLYGDMCGGLAVLADVYKTDVYRLARYINRHREIIPVNTIVKPPSAELRPGQKDSDSLPDYDVLDKVLFQYIEKCKGKMELEAMGFDTQLVARVVKLVNSNEWKRFQSAPVLRISPKAFGKGRQMPLAGKYF